MSPRWGRGKLLWKERGVLIQAHPHSVLWCSGPKWSSTFTEGVSFGGLGPTHTSQKHEIGLWASSSDLITTVCLVGRSCTSTTIIAQFCMRVAQLLTLHFVSRCRNHRVFFPLSAVAAESQRIHQRERFQDVGGCRPREETGSQTTPLLFEGSWSHSACCILLLLL